MRAAPPQAKSQGPLSGQWAPTPSGPLTPQAVRVQASGAVFMNSIYTQLPVSAGMWLPPSRRAWAPPG